MIKARRIHSVITVMLLALTLQGCLGTAFVAGAAMGGAVVYDRRTLKTMRDDFSISQSVKRKIFHDKALQKQSHIIVAVFNHVVLLAGQTPQEGFRHDAQRLAEQVLGVKRVFNHIRIAGPTANLTRSADTWITTKVKTHMLSTRGLHSSQIKVVTENGVVYLMGLVTPKQGKLATNAARRVAGVQGVVKIFEYEL